MSKPVSIYHKARCKDCGVIEELSVDVEVVDCEQCSKPICTDCQRKVETEPAEEPWQVAPGYLNVCVPCYRDFWDTGQDEF
jgi:hypothetical protein